MTTLPRLETERLVLTVPERGSHIALRDLLADPEVYRYLGPRPEDPLTDMFDRTLRGAGSWLLYGYGFFMLHLKADGAFIGQAGVFHSVRGFGKGLDDVPEAGWILARPYWGQGLAREAMDAILRWFDAAHGRQRITCMIEDGNAASFALAGRLGFVEYDQDFGGDEPLALLERL